MTPQDQPNPLKEIFTQYGVGVEPVYQDDGKLHNQLTVNGQDAIAAIKAYFLDLIGDDEPAIKYGNRRPSTVDEWENDMALARNAVRRELREKLK